ncbi:hypothetical protein QYM36_017173, partial [Artemia franciscana]
VNSFLNVCNSLANVGIGFGKMTLRKNEIDQAVDSILRKAKDENQKRAAYLRLSKLYFQVSDIDSSKKYCLMYMDGKETVEGLVQMAQIAAAQGRREEALEKYIKCFHLDPTKKEIIVKVIELLNQLPLDREKASYWLEKAEPIYSRNVAVKSLRERLTSTSGQDALKENLLKDEISKMPFDASLKTKLLRLYMDWDMYDKAYEFAKSIEETDLFHEELEYYETLDLLATYLPSKLSRTVGIDYHVFHVSIVERLCALMIASKRDVTTSEGIVKANAVITQLLLRFDKYLHNIMHTYKNNTSEYWKAFITNMKGQLYYHMLCVLLFRMRNEISNTKENRSFVNTLLLAAFNTSPFDLNAQWIETEIKRKLCLRWHHQAADRLVITGHMILAACGGKKERFFDSVYYEKKDKIFQCVVDCDGASSESFFVNVSNFEVTKEDFPNIELIQSYERYYQTMNTTDLQRIVWLAKRYKDIEGTTEFGALPTDFKLAVFPEEELPFSTINYKSSHPESICQLDVEAFIYCTVLCASNKGQMSTKYALAPPSLSMPLCTSAQRDWWVALVRLVKNEASKKVGEFKRILQRGIEAVRLIGFVRMSSALVVQLAKIFSEKAINYDDGLVHLSFDPFRLPDYMNDEMKAISHRASLYWQHFLTGGMVADPVSILHRDEKLFEFPGQLLISLDSEKLRDEALFFLGIDAIRSRQLDHAFTYLEDSSRPEASYYIGLIYRNKAIEELRGTRPSMASPSLLSAYHASLQRAREAFHLTLDRLRQPGIDPGNELNKTIAEVIEDVDERLASDSMSPTNNREVTEKVLSSNNSTFYGTPKSSIRETPKSCVKETPVKGSKLSSVSSSGPLSRHGFTEARPSPERLDGQIRALSATHSLAVQTTMEQYRLLLDEVKAIKASIPNIKEINAMHDQKFQVLEDHLKEMTKQIADLTLKIVRRSRSRRQSESIANEEDLYEYDDYVEQYDEDENLEAIGGAPRRRPRAPPQQRQTPQLPPTQPATFPGFPYPPHLLALMADPNLQAQLALSYGTFGSVFPWLQQQQYQLGLAGLQGTSGVQVPQSVHPLQTQPQVAPQPAPVPQPSIVPPSTAQPNASTIFQPSPPKTDLLTVLLNKPVESKMPQNVVISTSATLPSATVSAPVLAPVTIPPHHRLGTVTPQKQPNSYQIALPDTAKIITSSPLDGKQTTPVRPPDGFLSSVPEPKFSSVGKPTEQQKTPVRDRNTSIGSEASFVEEEIDAMPDFKPIIPLPEEVEVKTGEEGEEVLFDERAKLYRFVDKEWKERGTGQIKILKDPETGKHRIVMRRDRVHKVCANHPIEESLKINFMPNTNNSLFWAAPDHSEGSMVIEKFSVKFKEEEGAKRFKEVFEAGVEAAKKRPKEVKKDEKKIEGGKGFGDKFKLASNQWECKVCCVRNESDCVKCLSCGTAKPDAVTTSTSTILSSPKFNFGLPATTSATTGGFSFSTPDVSNLKICSVAGAGEKKQESRSAFQFSFSPKITEGVKQVTIQPSKLFAFGTPTGTGTGEQTKPVTSVFGTSPASILESGTARYGTSTPVNLTITPITKTTSAPELDKGTKPISSAIGASSAGSIQARIAGIDTATPVTTSTAAPTKPTGSLMQPKFTIGSSQLTPKLSETEEKKKEETAKPNVFAGFTFGSPKLNELKPEDKTELKSDNGKKKSEEVTLTSILKGKDDTPKAGESTGMLFSSLTGSTEATCFKKTDDFKGFPGQGTPVFGKPKKEPTPLAAFPGSMERKAETPEEEVSEEFVPTAEFKPVIPLPDLVEVKTGEDEETVLFSNRGILYRFDADTKEWKEKGRGDFKVLRHQKTGKVRFLMRREQVLKICCNHLITPELELMPMNNSDKAFVWYALDYSEGEMKEEKLALRFKLPDTSPAKSRSKNASVASENELYEEDEHENSIHFEPIIPLPDKIEVRTGEEEEISYFVHKAKLFRMAKVKNDKGVEVSEWKERGLGEMKVLRHRLTGKCRLLMRREQVHKVCLNHGITKEMKLITKDDKKSVMWAARDFSEVHEGTQETFLLRFKTPELLNNFLDAINKALEGADPSKKSEELGVAEKVEEPKKDDDIEIVYEYKPTEEERKRATELQLPASFFNYKNKPPCPGCIGCKTDDHLLDVES